MQFRACTQSSGCEQSQSNQTPHALSGKPESQTLFTEDKVSKSPEIHSFASFQYTEQVRDSHFNYVFCVTKTNKLQGKVPPLMQTAEQVHGSAGK